MFIVGLDIYSTTCQLLNTQLHSILKSIQYKSIIFFILQMRKLRLKGIKENA